MAKIPMKTMPAAFLATIFLSFTANVFAQSVTQLQVDNENDLTASELKTTPTMPLINQSREDVSISWGLADAELSEIPKPYRASSREYWLYVDGEQLQRGFKLQTTAIGAVVKISPVADKETISDFRADLTIDSFVIMDSQGKQYSARSVVAQSATAAQLNNNLPGFGFSAGTIIFKLAKTLGQGEFTIKTNDTTISKQKYLIYVLDKNSDYGLSVQTKDDTAFAGRSLAAEITLTQGGVAQNIGTAEVYLRSPGGEKIAVDHNRGNNRGMEVSLEIENLEKNIGIWELHVITKGLSNGLQVQRNAKTSFAFSRPNAALLKTVSLTRPDKQNNTLALDFGLNAVSSGRFELRGTLYATDRQGDKQPLMFANSAGWREAGTSSLGLEFDLDKVDASGLKGPYEIRDLRLLDQSRMMLLHRQRLALSFQ